MEDDLLAAMMDFDVRCATLTLVPAHMCQLRYAHAPLSLHAHASGQQGIMIADWTALRDPPQDPAPVQPHTVAPMSPGELLGLRTHLHLFAESHN